MKTRDFEKMITQWADNVVKNVAGDDEAPTKTSPAMAVHQTDSGPVLVLDPTVLLGKSVEFLRESGLTISASVPNSATVIRDFEGRLLFQWRE